MQDVRGRYRSEGEFVPFVKEYEDGYDSVEWAAKLPGSNGSVGMYGLSYFGKTQWHAAIMRPPSLKSMVPGLTWGNHLNGVQMRGGAQELGLMQYWAQGVPSPGPPLPQVRWRPREASGRSCPRWSGSWTPSSPAAATTRYRSQDSPNPDGWSPSWGGFGRSVDDQDWEYLNIEGKYDSVDAPTFHIGGWYDCFIGETLRQYEAMKERSRGSRDTSAAPLGRPMDARGLRQHHSGNSTSA